MFHIPSGPHPEFAAVDVLESILTQAPSGKLYKALVETKKATSISGRSHGFAEGGLLAFWADLRLEQSLSDARTGPPVHPGRAGA